LRLFIYLESPNPQKVIKHKTCDEFSVSVGRIIRTWELRTWPHGPTVTEARDWHMLKEKHRWIVEQLEQTYIMLSLRYSRAVGRIRESDSTEHEQFRPLASLRCGEQTRLQPRQSFKLSKFLLPGPTNSSNHKAPLRQNCSNKPATLEV